MKTLSKIGSCLLLAFLLLLACNQEPKTVSDLQIVRNNNNKKSYPVTKIDSAQAIENITRQKIQEILDLAALYTAGNRDTEIDSVIYAQMQGYFLEPDSLKLNPLLLQLDSLKAKSAKVQNIAVRKEIRGTDTLDLADFNVEYFDGFNRSVGTRDKNVQYKLQRSPVKFKKEFKFYFVKFDVPPANDSTSVGVTK
ncbi:hypothetical protein MVI27_09695 [Chryseobacterium salipaludis]|uniref:hypothetical protein n=1 Tax=Chryseobacterium TaxID=59732 RepID=UPI001FF52869|nr:MULTISPECIES: hypothetical protein [Chryseobacterium]MCJ8498534.1 hypothetical protein [Chryseobacterium salipaludis]MCX3297141.1 hypothetical protein [Planobacterium sp. JC490]